MGKESWEQLPPKSYGLRCLFVCLFDWLLVLLVRLTCLLIPAGGRDGGCGFIPENHFINYPPTHWNSICLVTIVVLCTDLWRSMEKLWKKRCGLFMNNPHMFSYPSWIITVTHYSRMIHRCSLPIDVFGSCVDNAQIFMDYSWRICKHLCTILGESMEIFRWSMHNPQICKDYSWEVRRYLLIIHE